MRANGKVALLFRSRASWRRQETATDRHSPDGMARMARNPRVAQGVSDLVRLRACLASEVKVLVRHTHSGL